MDANEAVKKFLVDSLNYSNNSGQSGNFDEAFRRLKETLFGLELEKIFEAVKKVADRGIKEYEEEMKQEVLVFNQGGIPLLEGAPIKNHWPVKIEPDVDDADLCLDMNDDNPMPYGRDPLLCAAAAQEPEEERRERPVAPRFLRQPLPLPPPKEEPAAPVHEMGGLQLAAGPFAPQPPARAPKKERKGVCPDCGGSCSKTAARCRPCRGRFVKQQTAARK
ncbi:hypothetical protein M3Y99_01637900 [Aphelenchoides fujianensis]|nr:hypothetical protein M3Y99_01637900 [Aphelenchoides fujianensis]